MKRRATSQPLVRKDVYNTPSGLGGIFDVIIIEDRGDIALVEVQYPTRDWQGYRFTCAKDTLKLTAKFVMVKGGAA